MERLGSLTIQLEVGPGEVRLCESYATCESAAIERVENWNTRIRIYLTICPARRVTLAASQHRDSTVGTGIIIYPSIRVNNAFDFRMLQFRLLQYSILHRGKRKVCFFGFAY